MPAIAQNLVMPWAVLYGVLDAMKLDVPFLRVAALVCRNWYFHAYSWMYEEVEFEAWEIGTVHSAQENGQLTSLSFTAHLTRISGLQLGSFVKSIIFRGPTLERQAQFAIYGISITTPNLSACVLRKFLLEFPVAESLVIENLQWFICEREEIHVCLTGLPQRRSMKWHVKNVCKVGADEHVLDLLQHTTGVDYLIIEGEVDGLVLNQHLCVSRTPITALHFRKMFLQSCSVFHTFVYLPKNTLVDLTVDGLEAEEVLKLDIILRRQCKSLLRLAIGLTLPEHTDRMNLWEKLELRSCRRLTSFVVTFSPCLLSPAHAYVLQTSTIAIMKTLGPTVRFLTVESLVTTSAHSKPRFIFAPEHWSSLAHTVSALPRLLRLEILVSVVRPDRYTAVKRVPLPLDCVKEFEDQLRHFSQRSKATIRYFLETPIV